MASVASHHPDPRSPGARLPRALSAVVLVGLVVAGAGCTGDDGEPGRRSTAAPAQPAAEPVAEPAVQPAAQESGAFPAVWTTVQVGEVTGRWPRESRKALRSRIRGVFDRWADAAYLGGRYPRRGFADAFPGFTRGARAEARRDLRLMTNADVSERIELVRHRDSSVWLDVLAVRRNAAALTARFRLAFNTRGQLERWVVVRGRLYLTRKNNRWRIFGYDVAKGRL